MLVNLLFGQIDNFANAKVALLLHPGRYVQYSSARKGKFWLYSQRNRVWKKLFFSWMASVTLSTELTKKGVFCYG